MSRTTCCSVVLAALLVASAAAMQPVAKAVPACGPTGPFNFSEIETSYEPGCLAVLGPLAKRDGATLTLALANGQTKTFRNEGGRPAWGSHHKPVTSWKTSVWLVAYDPAASAFTIRAADGSLVGIDARDGHETAFGVDFPHFAPGGVYALTIADEGTGAVTVRDVSGSPARVVWADTPKVPSNRSFIAWDGDRRARLLVEDMSVAFLDRDAAGLWTYETLPMVERKVEAPPTCMPDPASKAQKLDACLAKLDGMVIDNGTLHSLRLENGRRKRLIDDRREGWATWTRYELAGYDPRRHVYVIHTNDYEGTGNMMLVDTRSGEEVPLGDGAQAPYFSPDGSHFIYVLSGDLENNGAGTELHLWEWLPKPKESWTEDISDEAYQVESVTGWEGDKRFGLRLVDGRNATVSKDERGTWHYEAFGTPRPPSAQP